MRSQKYNLSLKTNIDEKMKASNESKEENYRS